MQADFFKAVIYPLIARFLVALVMVIAISLGLALIANAMDGNIADQASHTVSAATLK